MSRLLGWAEGRDRLPVASDQYGRPTYAPTLAEALLTLARRLLDGAASGGLMHLADESVLSRAEQTQIILEAASRRGRPATAVIPFRTCIRHRRGGPSTPFSIAAWPRRQGIALGPFHDDLEATLDALLGPDVTHERLTV